MPDGKVIVVFGATGRQGGAIINSLLENKIFQIRAVTRDITKPSALELQKLSPRITLVEADLDNKAQLRKALDGAYGVFAVTNYWDTMKKEVEYEQGKNIADVAKETGVEHLVWSTLIDVNKLTNGALPGVFHFDIKAKVEEYIREQKIPATFFYPGFYMSNLFRGVFAPVIKDSEVTFTLPLPKDALFPLINIGESGLWVKAIFEKGFTDAGRKEILGMKVLAASDYYTPVQVVETVGKVLGKPGRYIRGEDEDFKKKLEIPGAPDFIAEEVYQNVMLLKPEHKGYYGGESLQPSLNLLERKPSTWEEFFSKEGKEKLIAWNEEEHEPGVIF